MSWNRQITDCFKMKKPRSSPPKEASSTLATPKRRLGKPKSTPHKLRSTPNGCNESSPQNCHEQTYDNAPVDLDNFTVEEFLCSQDVVNSDVTWDCSSPRNRLVAARSPGRSDVQSLVKLFRSKPQETKPTTSALSIISPNFVTASTLGHVRTPRKKKGGARKGTSATSSSAQAVMAQMQELWDIVQQSKQNGFLPAVAERSAPLDTRDAASSDILDDSTASDVEEDIASQKGGTSITAEVVVPVEESTADDEDYDTWLTGDESILAAATQDIELPLSARKPFKTPTRSSKAQSSPDTTCDVPAASSTSTVPLRKTPTMSSPRQRQDGRCTPNRLMSATRKSPRLSMMLLNKTPSPLHPAPVRAEKPTPAVEAPPRPLEASSRKSSTEVLFEDDDEDEFLDQICSTLEQQQQLEAKVAAISVPPLFKAPATSAASSSLAVVSAFRSSSSTSITSSKTISVSAPKAEVSKGSTALCRLADCASVKKIGLPKEMSGSTLVSVRPAVSDNAASFITASKGSSISVAKPVAPSSSHAVNQKPVTCAQNSLARSVQVVLQKCAAPPVKAPPLKAPPLKAPPVKAPPVKAPPVKAPPVKAPPVKTPPVKAPVAQKRPSPSPPRVPMTLKLHQYSRSPSRQTPLSASRSGNMSVYTTARTGEAGLDFDDDDSDLATPEVMSWLEEVESQPAPLKKCTPEEIAKKRAEALQRRRLREQASNKWKGRLRMSK
ncbi:uncharacterized protein LOC144133052 [Amblyomma americanum]